MTDELGIAVIGSGRWGSNLIRNLLHADGWDLRWVCDLDEQLARRALGKRTAVAVTSCVDEILADHEVAAVVVATPAETHGELATEVLNANRHLLVEKPLACSVGEGEAMVALALERDLILMCDHTYCYTSAVRHIRSLLHTGAIGEVQYFDSVRTNLGVVQHDVDVFWDLAAHDLSILDFILPDEIVPTSVAAHGADPIGAGRACIGYVVLQLAGGGIAHTHVNWLSPTKIRQTIIGGSGGMIVWDDLNPSERVRIYDKSVSLTSGFPANPAEAMISYRLGDMVAPALSEKEALSRVVEEFHHAVTERRPAQTSGEAGVRLLRILEATTTSLASGGEPVRLYPGRPYQLKAY